MKFDRRNLNKELNGEFVCGGYKRKGKDFCTTHYITYENIYNVLLADIRSKSTQANKNEQRFLRLLEKESQLLKTQKANKIQRDISHGKTKIEKLDKIISDLYKDKALGNITLERFKKMSREYEDEQKELISRVDEAERILNKQSESADKIVSFTEFIKEITNITELTPDILSRLIKKITVGHAMRNPVSGGKEQEINIEFTFCA